VGRISGINEPARDNRDGLIMLRTIMDGLGRADDDGYNIDRYGKKYKSKNQFSLEKGRLTNLLPEVFDDLNQPLVTLDGSSRTFKSIDFYTPRGAGIISHLLARDNEVQPTPAPAPSPQLETAAAAPHHPAPHLNPGAPADTPD
jgi:hypothetical protein